MKDWHCDKCGHMWRDKEVINWILCPNCKEEVVKMDFEERLNKICDPNKDEWSENEKILSKDDFQWLISELHLKKSIAESQGAMIESLYKKIRDFKKAMDTEIKFLKENANKSQPYHYGSLLGMQNLDQRYEWVFGKKDVNY